MYIYKAGVIGAGTMGGSIAQVISYSGLPVVIKDIDEAAVSRGIGAAERIYKSRVKKGKMTESEMREKMLLISGTLSYEDFSDVDFVIEAVTEKMEIKKSIFSELGKVCQENTIFASNTSALSISELASSLDRSDQMIGFHFFNPAHVMKLIEVIPGIQTSEETIETAVSFAESLRKIPVRVNECAGFLVNRLLMPYINESFFVLEEGVMDARSIDEELVRFGMPMGPFTLADMLGLDVCAEVADIHYDYYGERMMPSGLLRKLTASGRYGVKSGGGVYEYNEQGENRILKDAIQAVNKDRGIKESNFSVLRVLLPMVNEAVIAFQEGVAGLSDIDIAMMAGTGFPQETGGPLHWADQLGLDTLLEKMKGFKGEHGPRFHPAPMIRRYVSAGWLGKKVKRGFFDYS